MKPSTISRAIHVQRDKNDCYGQYGSASSHHGDSANSKIDPACPHNDELVRAADPIVESTASQKIPVVEQSTKGRKAQIDESTSTKFHIGSEKNRRTPTTCDDTVIGWQRNNKLGHVQGAAVIAAATSTTDTFGSLPCQVGVTVQEKQTQNNSKNASSQARREVRRKKRQEIIMGWQRNLTSREPSPIVGLIPIQQQQSELESPTSLAQTASTHNKPKNKKPMSKRLQPREAHDYTKIELTRELRKLSTTTQTTKKVRPSQATKRPTHLRVYDGGNHRVEIPRSRSRGARRRPKRSNEETTFQWKRETITKNSTTQENVSESIKLDESVLIKSAKQSEKMNAASRINGRKFRCGTTPSRNGLPSRHCDANLHPDSMPVGSSFELTWQREPSQNVRSRSRRRSNRTISESRVTPGGSKASNSRSRPSRTHASEKRCGKSHSREPMFLLDCCDIKTETAVGQ